MGEEDSSQETKRVRSQGLEWQGAGGLRSGDTIEAATVQRQPLPGLHLKMDARHHMNPRTIVAQLQSQENTQIQRKAALYVDLWLILAETLEKTTHNTFY